MQRLIVLLGLVAGEGAGAPLSLLASVAGLLQTVVAAPPGQRPAKDVPPRTELKHSCSRPISRHVRKVLEREILRPAAQAKIDRPWPSNCPFDPVRDLYGVHEKQKQRKRGTGALWTCNINGKTFRNEHYLDLHLERHHMNLTPAGGVCLADYCEVFEVCHGESKFRRRDADQLACNDTVLQKHKQRCDAAMAKCFPLGNESSRKLHAQFSRQWCQVLNCQIREERLKEHHMDLTPMIVLLILVMLICFIVFSMVVCCVDYSDDILQFMVDSGVASRDFMKRMVQMRKKTRETIGMPTTKGI